MHLSDLEVNVPEFDASKPVNAQSKLVRLSLVKSCSTLSKSLPTEQVGVPLG